MEVDGPEPRPEPPLAAQPAAEPPVAAQPAAPTAPVAATPTPAAPATPAWTPPDTFSDRFSRWSTAAVRYSVASFGLLSLVVGVLWLVPTIAVSTSDSYRIACSKLAGEPTLQDYIGQPIVCERTPDWYRVDTPEGDVFRFQGKGPHGHVEAEVFVKDGVARLGTVIYGLSND